MKRYLVQTFGCQMNVHDSRRIEEVLARAGWEPTDEAALASLVVFNTCSVREKAEHKLLSVLGTMRGLKQANPDLVIAVAGCVAQQEGERLLTRAPIIDVVIGPDNIPELPGLVAHAHDGGPPIARTVFDLDDPRFLEAIPTRAESPREVTSFVTVMKGCDERCTFCIVPYTRGPERYRSADAIVAEVRGMADAGVREVTLLGQTVNSWFEPGTEESARESQFAELLSRIAREVPSLRRLRYTSPHPRHVTDALVRAHAELDVLPAHVHLPVQSGSNRVLKRMLRRYTREHYVARARALQGARAGLTLSTDLIVGFPGETEDEFLETLSLVREVGFVAAFAFKYSPRPHTPALKLGDDVTEEQKDDRLARLLEVVAEQQRAHLASLVGTRTEVLFESLSQESKNDRPRAGEARWKGRSSRHEIVHADVPEGIDLAGAILPVTVERANAHSLVARVDADVASLPRIAPKPAPTKSAAAPTRTRLPVVGRAQDPAE
ncbi:tRNA (N6-isopentenyl adenosine(37)-C2)-methylthiotransferase MiaB [Sandaracinus amylolyticus]|uniref:tRNA (N6-isopentenyl adenosine(37)-C2)-methylthiotransferase MiaB n=1 Tax=Sandaracinus amylolyticus TaxID=927083 RepID=UPI001F019102|nr:tRNA (N6-isopentenyl adenosine(37)-C2)-methylthiotransferase MiaB [Sandaracinus amylolyticus]UJR81189.1 Dimethylallyladenosine tRNA methylthiotransferase [Sandaracinus amylolyticus]